MLKKADIEQFYKDVQKLDLKFPGAVISEETGHSKANVSKYLKRKLEPSEAFLKAFYEKFHFDGNNVSRENGKPNQNDLQTIVRDLTETRIKHEAALNIIAMTLAEMLAGKSGKSTAYEHSELLRTISSESDRLLNERRKTG